MMGKLDPRKQFAGADPSEQIRKLAKSMMDIGLEHAEEKRRKSLEYQYTTAPYLEVVVSQLCADPPMWRMETVTPIIAEYGVLHVDEPDQRHLEPELRIMAARILLKYGYVPNWDEAREWVKKMEIQRRGRIVMPRDSERFLFERGK